MNNSNTNTIHPLAEIHPSVKIGEGNTFSKGVVIKKGVEIGSGNYFGEYSVIGGPPETVHKTPTDLLIQTVRIGDQNSFREFCTISAGTISSTTVNSNCLFMRNTHVGHDSKVGSSVTLSSNSILAGHAVIYPRANIGLSSTVHQRSAVGFGSMVGMSTAVRRFSGHLSTSNGNPAKVLGFNRKFMAEHKIDERILEICQDQNLDLDLITEFIPVYLQNELFEFLRELRN